MTAMVALGASMRPVASFAVRTIGLITIASLLILVLLPAALGAAGV